jgi:hypothetical protein
MNRRHSLLALLPFALVACGPADELEALQEGAGSVEQAACSQVMTATFGLADNFANGADPIPYTPAMPEFVNYLALQGVASTQLKTFDDFTANRHMVATLRHGLRSCFAPNCSLKLCVRARAHADAPKDDRISVYNTDFGVYSFPSVTSVPVVPALVPSWNPGDLNTLCVPLNMNLVGDMLQFQMQDDTAVDYIQMVLSC